MKYDDINVATLFSYNLCPATKCPQIYFLESVKKDQPALMCSLTLLCTLHCFGHRSCTGLWETRCDTIFESFAIIINLLFFLGL